MSEDNSKYENFNYDENLDYLIRAKNGDKEATDILIKMNLPLVNAISRKFTNRGYEYEDIYQIGCIGLVKAINNFDSTFNVRFSTYAVPMIMGEIKRFLRDDGIIKISRNLKNLARKVHYAREDLTKEFGREPTIEEISSYSSIPVEDIIAATESSNSMQYLYDTIHQDDGSPVLLIDKLSENADESSNMIDTIALKEALRNLDKRSRQVIMLRYFKDKTQNQVAKLLGISQVQVSRIEKKVLKTMKDSMSG